MKNYQIFLLFILLFNGFAQPAFAGKKQCKPYLSKLQNIQSKQRQGHSLKRSISLKNQESKARATWWQCEQGKLKKKKSSSKVKKEKARSQTRYQAAPSSPNSFSVSNTFNTSHAVVVKAAFKGEKQQAWLDYYQRPDKCKRPKSTQTFAFCMEDKQAQQSKFSAQYQSY